MKINKDSTGVLFSDENVAILKFDKGDNLNSVFRFDETQQLMLFGKKGNFSQHNLFIDWSTFKGTAEQVIDDDIETIAFEFDGITGSWVGASFYDLANDLFKKYQSKFRFSPTGSHVIEFIPTTNEETRALNEHQIQVRPDLFSGDVGPKVIIHEIIHLLLKKANFDSDEEHYTLNADYGSYTNQQLMLEGNNGIFLDFYNNLKIHGIDPLAYVNENFGSRNILNTTFLPEWHEIGFDPEGYIRDNYDAANTVYETILESRLSNVNPHRLIRDITNVLESPISKKRELADEKVFESEYNYFSKFNSKLNKKEYIKTNVAKQKQKRIELANTYLEYINIKYPRFKKEINDIRKKYSLNPVKLIRK